MYSILLASFQMVGREFIISLLYVYVCYHSKQHVYSVGWTYFHSTFLMGFQFEVPL
jgi:hypothetical protein